MAVEEFIVDGETIDFEKKYQKLGHINDIEKPKNAGKLVEVEAVISSTSIAFQVPRRVEYPKLLVKIKTRDEEEKHWYEEGYEIEITRDEDLLRFVMNTSEKVESILRKYMVGVRLGEKEVVKVFEPHVSEYYTIYHVRVRPLVKSLRVSDSKIVDEQNQEYKHHDIFMLVKENKPNIIPGKPILLKGKVIPHPKTQKASLLAYEVELIGDVNKYDKSVLRELQDYFQRKSVDEIVEWYLSNFEFYSHIIGRENISLTGFLTFFSPLYMGFLGEEIRGWLNTAIIGDTTTGKSETITKMIRLLDAGTIITGETASSVGLAGTVTQIEKTGWSIDWGLLVLNDTALLAIDGAHRLGKSQWSELAESERTGMVTIAKAAKGTAPARTRLIKIANPLNPEDRTTADLSDFPHRALALTTIFNRESIARLDLAVFSDKRDVSPQEINVLITQNPDQRIHHLKELVRWVWSGVNIVFEEDAVKEILSKATELIERFSTGRIPLVSADMSKKLARLSAALAVMTLSGDIEAKKVVVRKEHVDYIVGFIEEEYEKAGLDKIAEEEKVASNITTEEIEKLREKIRDITASMELDNIVAFIGRRGTVTRDDLMTQFELKEKTELRPLISTLKTNNILKQSNRGFSLTRKGIALYNILINKNEEHTQLKNSNRFTEKNNDFAKSTKSTNPKERTLTENSGASEGNTEEKEEQQPKDLIKQVINEVRKKGCVEEDELIKKYGVNREVIRKLFIPQPGETGEMLCWPDWRQGKN